MNYKILCIVLVVLLCICTAFTVCTSLGYDYPKLTLTGDVAETIALNELWQSFEQEKVVCQGEAYKAVALGNILQKAQVLGQLQAVYFVAEDGFTSIIKAEDAALCYISRNPKNEWSVLAPRHPVSTNAKHVSKIILLASGAQTTALSVTDVNGNTTSYSLGALLSGVTVNYPYWEGEATVEDDGKTYRSTIYTRRCGVNISELLSESKSAALWLKDKQGNQFLAAADGYLLFEEQHLNYMPANGKVYENIVAVTVPSVKLP